MAQPDLVLSPSYYYSKSNSNNIPVYITPDNTNSNSNTNSKVSARDVQVGLDGTAIDITNDIPSGDLFNGCAQGASYLKSMSSYLLSSSSSSLTFGAITISNTTDDNNLVYNIMINASAVHGTGVFTNVANNGYFKAMTNDDSATITTHNYPLPLTNREKIEGAAISGFVVVIYIVIGFAFIPGIIIIIIITIITTTTIIIIIIIIIIHNRGVR